MNSIGLYKHITPSVPILDEIRDDFTATPKWRKDFWGMVFRRSDIQEFRDLRIHIAYRVTRYILQVSSSVDKHEQLRPKHFEKLQLPSNTPTELKLLEDKEPLALCPNFMKDHSTFLEMFLWGARESGAVYGTVNFPHMFSVAMQGATKENMMVFYPTPREIVNYEQELLLVSGRMLIDKGQVEVLKYLSSEGGFTEDEVALVLSMCKRRNRKFLEDDIEDSRATMIMRLESAVSRARKSMDIRAELAALKMLSSALGLDKVERPGELDQMIDVIRNISKAAKAVEIPETTDAEFE